MMVPPEYNSEANAHWQRLRSLDAQHWHYVITNTTYTKVLINFVAELMSLRESVGKAYCTSKPVDRAERTFYLYRKARVLYDRFRTVKDEGKDVVTSTHVQIEQGKRDRRADEEHAKMEKYREDLLEYFQTSNRFTGVVVPPTSMDDLLEEIEAVCEEADTATYETQSRPGMVY
jgi:hypothetical protein